MNLAEYLRIFCILKYRIFNSTTATHGTVFKIDHLLGHKDSLRKYRKAEIILYILSNHNGIRNQQQKTKTKKPNFPRPQNPTETTQTHGDS